MPRMVSDGLGWLGWYMFMMDSCGRWRLAVRLEKHSPVSALLLMFEFDGPLGLILDGFKLVYIPFFFTLAMLCADGLDGRGQSGNGVEVESCQLRSFSFGLKRGVGVFDIQAHLVVLELGRSLN